MRDRGEWSRGGATEKRAVHALGRAAQGGDGWQVVELAERRGVAHGAAQATGEVVDDGYEDALGHAHVTPRLDRVEQQHV